MALFEKGARTLIKLAPICLVAFFIISACSDDIFDAAGNNTLSPTNTNKLKVFVYSDFNHYNACPLGISINGNYIGELTAGVGEGWLNILWETANNPDSLGNVFYESSYFLEYEVAPGNISISANSTLSPTDKVIFNKNLTVDKDSTFIFIPWIPEVTGGGQQPDSI